MGNNTGFNGTFDGQGNAISNMTIADSEYAGLFAYIEEEGTVQNATFKGVELSLQTADSYAGVVAGRNDGTITHCRIEDGAVTFNDVNSRTGGIAGHNYGTVSFCEVTDCSVSNTSGIAGGIVGESSYGGQITGCSFDGQIVVGAYGGGIAGSNSGDIGDCNNRQLGYFYYGCVAEGTGKDTPEEVDAECITATRVRFLPERDVQQNGAVTRNLVGKDVFWVDVETMGTNPDKVESPDDEQEGSGQGSFG